MISDGLYRVDHGTICAGFVIVGGRLVACAPVLRRRWKWWLRQAVRISD